MPMYESDEVDPFDSAAVQAAAQRRLQAKQASSTDKWGNAYSESIPMAETGAMTGLKFGGPVGAVVGGVIGGGIGAYKGYKSAQSGDSSKFKELAGVNAGNMSVVDQFKGMGSKKPKDLKEEEMGKPPSPEDGDVEYMGYET